MEQTSPVQFRRSFTISFKLKVLKFIESFSLNKAAKKWAIDHRLLRRWRKDQEKLKEASLKHARRHVEHKAKSSKRSGFDKNLEEILLLWIRTCRQSCKVVDSKAIKQKALTIARDADQDSSFQASSGWIHRFLKRNGLACRRISTTGRDLPSNTAEIIDKWYNETEYLLNKNKKSIFNMDETAIYLDSPGKSKNEKLMNCVDKLMNNMIFSLSF